MAFGNSSLQDRTVFAQDTKPTIEKDGVLWVDTSKLSRPLHVYSEGEGDFIPVNASEAIKRVEETLSFAESHVSLSGEGYQVTDGDVAFLSEANEQTIDTGANSNQNQYGGRQGNYVTFKEEGITQIDARLFNISGSVEPDTAYLEGPGIEKSKAIGGHGSTVTFDIEDQYTVGEQYALLVDRTSDTNDPYIGYYIGSLPVEDDRAIMEYNTGTSNQARAFRSVTTYGPWLEANAQVEIGSLPEDLASWDIATYQKDEGNGAVQVDLERYDGANWVTVDQDVSRNIDISEYPSDENIRFAITLSRADDTQDPTVGYLARRYER